VHRFYAPDFPASGEVDLPEDEAQHLARVLRLGAGDAVAIFDGTGREALARVVSVTSRRVAVNVVEPRAAAPEPRVLVTLAQALLKSDKMDRVIRDAVTKGGRRDRWERTVISSVKQCGRAVVPPVHDTQSFEALLQSTTGQTRLMLVEPGAGQDVADVTTLEGQRPSEAIVLVGPEGGWDPQELADASAAGVKLLSFGRRVLRADAAGAAVISVLRYIWRDL
jgi:16S rRNA (uracil1498-N3)-methyltransferase